MLPAEKDLADQLKKISKNAVGGVEEVPTTAQTVWNPLVEVMSKMLGLHDRSPLADFKAHAATSMAIAHTVRLADPGEGHEFQNLPLNDLIERMASEVQKIPLDVLIHRMKFEVSKWKRRANVDMVLHSIESGLKCGSCVAELRARGMRACRDLEWVLRRRAAGDLQDTSLGSEEALVKFALDAWTVMKPQASELEGTALDGGITSDNVRRWLQQEDVLESLFHWRRLRRAGAELMDDADMVKKVAQAQPTSSAAVVEESVPVAKVSMLRRKRI